MANEGCVTWTAVSPESNAWSSVSPESNAWSAVNPESNAWSLINALAKAWTGVSAQSVTWTILSICAIIVRAMSEGTYWVNSKHLNIYLFGKMLSEQTHKDGKKLVISINSGLSEQTNVESGKKVKISRVM